MQNISSSSKISFPSPYVVLLFFLCLFLLFKDFLLQIFSSISFSIFSLLHKKIVFSIVKYTSVQLGCHCTAKGVLCSVYFSAQPNKLRPILKFEFCYPNEHIFVAACSSVRKIHLFHIFVIFKL